MAKAASVEDLVLEAVERALADPAPRPLHGTKANPGVFLSKTVAAKQAAQCCLDGGLIEKRGEQKGKGKGKAVNLYAVAPAGVAYLLEHDPMASLVQAASGGVENLAQAAGRCQETLEHVQQRLGQLRETLAGAAARLRPPDVERLLKSLRESQSTGGRSSSPAASPAKTGDAPKADSELERDVIRRLRQQKQQSPMRPIDLPQLYRFASSLRPDLSLGQFHDLLRRMAAARQVRLSPFTQAMYQLPEPECAMILGREVMYYVNAV